MARVLIHEPHDDTRVLLELIVARLGHEPSPSDGASVEGPAVDAAVIEPGDPEGVHLAEVLRGLNVPVIFTSIYPSSDDLLELGPTAYLVKPFPIYELERALEQALSQAAPAPSVAVR